MQRHIRHALFALIYFAQGTILSYYAALNVLYLRTFGLSMTRIGIFSAIALSPLVLKILLGLLSDRVNLLGRGHRLPYIVIGLLMQASAMAVFPCIHPEQDFGYLLAAAFIAMTGMALYDTCSDGLALDVTTAEDRETVQAIMVGSRALGVVCISVTLGLLADRADWRSTFWVMAGITLLPLALMPLVHEPPRPAGSDFSWHAFSAFRQRPVIALGVLGMLYSLIIYGTTELMNPFLHDRFAISYLEAGLFTGAWGVGVILGGMIGGYLSRRFGHRQTLMLAAMAAGITGAGLAAIGSPVSAWGLFFSYGVAFGCYETTYFTVAMGLIDTRIAASMFAILMATANLGTGFGLAAGGRLADLVGYRGTFVLLALLNLAVLPVANLIWRDKR